MAAKVLKADLKAHAWTLPIPLPPWLAWSERWWYWVGGCESWRVSKRDDPFSPRCLLAAALQLWLGQGPTTGQETGLGGKDASPNLRAIPIIPKTHFQSAHPAISPRVCLCVPSLCSSR